MIKLIPPSENWPKLVEAVILLGILTVSQTAYGGRYADSMLRMEVSPRAAALGGAAGALLENGAVFLQNPANISYVTKLRVRGLYQSQFGLASYHHLGIVYPIVRAMAVAVNWMRFSVNDIPLRPDLSGHSTLSRRNVSRTIASHPAGTFSDRENAFFLSVARMYRWDLDLGWRYFKLPVETPVGMNIKYLHRRLHTIQGHGLGVDCSVALKFSMAELLDYRWMGRAGISLLLKDFTGTPISWNTRSQDIIEPAWQWNWAYEQPIGVNGNAIHLVWRKSTRYRDGSGWGVEWQHRKLLAVQLGRNGQGLVGGISVGSSWHKYRLVFEYGFTRHVLGNVHKISCMLSL